MQFRSSDPAPLSRASLVIGLYGAMALVALIIAAACGDPDLYRIGSVSGWLLLLAPVLGVIIGLAVVALTRWATKRYAWARELRKSFRDLLGPLVTRDIVIIAVASAIGEELLFRGALMPLVGVWVQALVFALLHVGPRKQFLPWTASAAVLGLAFGLLARETGSLGAPIVAHFTINFFNLRYIVGERRAQVLGSATRDPAF